ncbi:MAG: metal-sensitive transcriptional regulator [Deltaproteobacteria bacterium]|nr:metal-sensitive transcriptional regulator [Deltaproteobacteria bacterium]
MSPRLKRAMGQIQGIERMIDEGRWCPDIVTQLRAVQAALRAVETTILDRYLEGCVIKIATRGDEQAKRAVIAELSDLVRRNPR